MRRATVAPVWAGLLWAGLACGGPSPAPDAGSADAATGDAAGGGRDAGPPPAPARGSCPSGWAPGCVAGFAVCGERAACPEGQTCAGGLCHLTADAPAETCRLPGERPGLAPGCPSGRACLVQDGSAYGLCVSGAVCRDVSAGWACRFYDGSPYDDSSWSGECPPSFPEFPYCGGVCGEEACPMDPIDSRLAIRYIPNVCVGVTATRDFGVCALNLAGYERIGYLEPLLDSLGVERGPLAGMQFAELPGTYFLVPLLVCLDYQSRVEGVTCVDETGTPY